MSKIPQKICRICEHETAAELINISLQNNYQSFIQKFLACANVTFDINDEYPKYFCRNCISILNIAYNFKIKCEQTQEKFQKLLQIDIIPTSLVSLKIENVELSNSVDYEHLYSSHVTESEIPIELDEVKSECNDYEESIEEETPTLALIDEKYQYIVSESKNDEKSEKLTEKCPICFKEFKLKSSVNRHIKEKHTTEKQQCKSKNDDKSEKLMGKCPICFKEFKFKSSVPRHITEKHTTETQQCKFCDEKFVNSTSLSFHRKLKHSETLRTCIDYNSLFVKKITAYECFICKNGKNFRQRWKLTCHMRTVHSDKAKPTFPCEICGKIFPYAANKRRHIEVVHFNKRLFVCSKCGKRFGSFYELENHETIHSDEKNFECIQCRKRFKTKDLLRQHTRILEHPSDSINASAVECKCCEICNKSITYNKLQQHMQTHCGVNQFKCQVCPKTFLHKSSLQKHNLVHSGEKPFKCETCSQLFRQINHLQNHRRTHSGEKPYQCKFCKKAFALNCNLKNHERLHTGEKPYQCNLCEEKFGHSKALKKHAATIHVGRETEAYTLGISQLQY